MDMVVAVGITSSRGSLPDYLVQASFSTKHLIENRFAVMSDMPIQVNIETAIVSQHVSKKYSSLKKPFEVSIQLADASRSGFGANPPCVSVSFLFEN